MASLVVTLDRQTLDELRAVARSERVTLGELMRAAIAEYLSQRLGHDDSK